MPTTIDEGEFEGQRAVVLASERARVVVLPRIGGKIASVLDRTTGHDVLWRHPDRGYREAAYEGPWTASDMGGWEDCLPTVAAGPYPTWPWQATELPEHGEVWALPWVAEMVDGGVMLRVHGVRLPYHFEKRVTLEGNRVRLSHRITNPSAFPIHYLWAAHPLFRVRPGMRIALPEGGRGRVDWSRDGRLGVYLDAVSWPETRDMRGVVTQLDRIGTPTLGHADKLYIAAGGEGWCGLHDPESEQALALRFDPRRLPYVGVWINQGGWPLDAPACYNVALEPTNGYPDLLHIAHARGTAATIAPQESQEWEVTLSFGRAASVRALLGMTVFA